MKKHLLSGFGLTLVLLMALPAAAEKGNREFEDGYKGRRHAESYSARENDQRRFGKDGIEEWRGHRKDMKSYFWALGKADSPRERARIVNYMRDDYRDFRQEVRQFKHHYRNPHQQDHYRHKPVIKHQHNGNRDYRHTGHGHGPGADQAACRF